jgi:tetratricopeptide (TPR) repeat protein
MNNVQPRTCLMLKPFDERVDILFRELELAIKWQRPSILFAVVCSECAYSDAKQALEDKLTALGQTVVPFQIRDDTGTDIVERLSQASDPDRVVFFVDRLSLGDDEEGLEVYSSLNRSREYFIDQRVRIVFWLTENEAVDLAHYAPDYWAFRHRVVEFVAPPESEEPFQGVAELAWQEDEAQPNNREDIDAKISMSESMLSKLSKNGESTANQANLALVLGILYWRRGNYPKAEEYLKSAFETAVRLRDKELEAQCFYANALLQTSMGRVDRAIKSYKGALDRAPAQVAAWGNLAVLYSKMDRHEEAIEAFRMVIEHDPKDAAGWNGLGEVLSKLQLYDDAIAAYQKAIDLSPNLVLPLVGLANVYANTGRADESIITYGQAIALNPRFLKAWFGLGDVLLSIGRRKDALKAYKKVVDQDPGNAQAWDELGKAYLRFKLYDDALVAFRRAVEIEPEYSWPYSHLGLAYCQLGKSQDAIFFYKKSLDLLENEADKVTAWKELGEAYRQAGDQANSEVAYQQAKQLEEELDKDGFDVNWDDLVQAEEKTPEDSGFDEGNIAAAESDREPEIDSAVGQFPPPIPVWEGEAEPVVGFVKQLDDSPLDNITPAADSVEMTGPDESPAEEMFIEQTPEAGIVEKELTAAAAESDGNEQGDENEGGENSQSAAEWNALGNEQLARGSYDEAIAAYIKAIELGEKHSWPYINNLALAHYYKGKYTDPASTSREVPEVHSGEEVPTAPVDGLDDVSLQEDGDGDTLTARQRIDKLESQTNALLGRARFLLANNRRGQY